MDIFALIENYFVQYGYLLIFLSAFFESLVIFGFILPGGAIILIGGFFARQGDLSLTYIFILATLGMFLGDIANYWLGRGGFSKWILKSGIYNYFFKKDKVRGTLSKYGPYSLFYFHIIGHLRSISCFTAGLTRFPFKKFLMIVAPASIIWSLIFLLAGYFFANATTDAKVLGGRITLLLVLMVLVFGAGHIFQEIIMNRLRIRKERKNA